MAGPPSRLHPRSDVPSLPGPRFRSGDKKTASLRPTVRSVRTESLPGRLRRPTNVANPSAVQKAILYEGRPGPKSAVPAGELPSLCGSVASLAWLSTGQNQAAGRNNAAPSEAAVQEILTDYGYFTYRRQAGQNRCPASLDIRHCHRDLRSLFLKKIPAASRRHWDDLGGHLRMTGLPGPSP